MIISDLGHFEVMSEVPSIVGGSVIDFLEDLDIKKITDYSKTIKTSDGVLSIYLASGTTKDGGSFSVSNSSASSY